MLRLVLAASLALGLAACRDERAVVEVWSATDAAAMKGVLDEFAARNPDIDIRYTEFNTSELHAATLAVARAWQASGEARQAPPDVVISSAMDLQVDLVNHGYARPIDVEGAGPGWSSWRGELFGFTAEPVAMVYNVAAFEGRELPQSRSELAGMIRDEPAFFDGRVGTYDITVSGVGYMFATQDAVRGYQSTRLVESLGRAGARTYCCSGVMIEHVASGDLVLAYNVIGSYAEAAAAADPRVALHFFSDYTLVFARSAFVPDWSAVPDAAARFVAYLVSPEGQAAIAGSSQLLPLTADGVVEAAADPNPSLTPVQMSPGLLAFLDTLKKKKFLREWSQSMFRHVP